MSRPRPVVPGIKAVTRRTTDRRFFIRPDAWVVRAFGYVLAVASRRHNVGVIAAVTRSAAEQQIAVATLRRQPTEGEPHACS